MINIYLFYILSCFYLLQSCCSVSMVTPVCAGWSDSPVVTVRTRGPWPSTTPATRSTSTTPWTSSVSQHKIKVLQLSSAARAFLKETINFNLSLTCPLYNPFGKMKDKKCACLNFMDFDTRVFVGFKSPYWLNNVILCMINHRSDW